MLCAVPSRLRKLRGEKISRTPAARRHACLLRLRDAPGTGRRSVLVLWCAPAFARVRVLAVLDTSAVGRLGIVRKQAGAGKHECKYPSVSITLASSRGRRALLSHLRPLASREQVQKFLVDRHVLAQSKTA